MTTDTMQARAALVASTLAAIGSLPQTINLRQAYVLLYIAGNPGATQAVLGKELEMPQSTVSHTLDYLKDLNWIKIQGDGMFKPHPYELTKTGVGFVKIITQPLAEAANG